MFVFCTSITFLMRNVTLPNTYNIFTSRHKHSFAAAHSHAVNVRIYTPQTYNDDKRVYLEVNLRRHLHTSG